MGWFHYIHSSSQKTLTLSVLCVVPAATQSLVRLRADCTMKKAARRSFAFAIDDDLMIFASCIAASTL